MAGTSDIYSWLYNPQLYYDPRTQSYRTPGFSQAAYWEDPTPVRAVTPIRADPTVTPTPPDNSAVAALRGVFPSRSNDAGGSQNGGDAGAGIDPLGGQALAPDGGYSIPAGDLWGEFSPFGPRDQGIPEQLAGALIGLTPGMIPGAGGLVGRAMDFSPGPTAQRDFGRIGALAQREAEQGIPFTQPDDPFAEGDLPNSELGWGLAERAAYDMGDRFRGAASPQQVGGPRFDDNGQPAAPRGAAAAAPQVTLAPQTTPFGETITATNTDGQGAKDAQAADTTKTGGGDVSASTSGEGGASKGDVSGSTGWGGDKTGGDNGSGAGSDAGGGKGADASSGGDVSGSSSADAGGGYGGDGGYGGGGDSGKGGGGDAGGGGGFGWAKGGPVRKPKGYRGPNPPGPDNMVGGLQTGEYVIPRSLTQGIQAGDPGSAMAALQGVRAGAPPRQPPPRAGGAMAAMHSVKGGSKKKPPTRPAR